MKTFFRRLALYIFAIWSFFPLYWLLNTSFKTSKDALARPPTFIFKPILKNYLDVIQNNEVWGYFVDSLIVALGTTFFGLLIGIPAAYVLARFKFKGNADFGFWILSTRMTPPIAMLIPFFIMYLKLGILDTHLGLIIAHVGLNLSIIVWLMRGFYEEIPMEIEEASYVDGSSFFQTFYKIAVPLSLPGISAVGIITFLFSWNEFLFALVLGDSVVRTSPVGLYGFVGYQQIYWGQLSASASLLLIPVLFFVFLFQKPLITGLTFGSFK